MSTTREKLDAKIAALQEKRRELLRPEVLAHIRREVVNYGFTSDDVFGVVSAAKPAVKRAKKPKKASVARFKDSEGNAWSGFGPKPKWLKEAIESGKTIEEFAV